MKAINYQKGGKFKGQMKYSELISGKHHQENKMNGLTMQILALNGFLLKI